MTDELKVAVVPGDDAAPEAVHAVMSVLHAMELPIAWEVLPDGVELAREHAARRRRGDGDRRREPQRHGPLRLHQRTDARRRLLPLGAPDLRQRATDQMATRLPLAAGRA